MYSRAIRPPAVAGSFYPADARALRALVERLLRSAEPSSAVAPPAALIAPHAGYVYSGPVAAAAFAQLRPHAQAIRRVLLLGPSHFVPLAGIGLTSMETFATPLGEVPIDAAAQQILIDMPEVETNDAAHAREHSLEVELPFLECILGEFALVPLVVGQAESETVACAIDAVANDTTVVVVSTDLSHYLPDAAARSRDARTADAIERLEPTDLTPDSACGFYPLAGLIAWARQRDLSAHRLALATSADTTGDKDRVVGYGAWRLDESVSSSR
jgi:AmmeMemoRadiSam system protein B